MIHCGYVKQNEESCYLTGRKCEQIGADNKLRKIMEEKIQPILKELCQKVNEGIVFYTIMNGGKVPQITVNNNEIININHKAYGDINFYEKITSRVLTAFADEKTFQEIVERWGLPGKYWDNLNDEAALKKAAEKIREQGFGFLDESPREVISSAVPVFTQGNALLGTIGCFAPRFRCDEAKQKLIVDSLKEAAEKIKTEI
jgi:DNA-binding IclR family transcriptional regulator